MALSSPETPAKREAAYHDKYRSELAANMSDVFSKAKRSEIMGRIRGKGNSSTEVVFARALRTEGVTGWRRHVGISIVGKKRGSPAVRVRPDFVLRSTKLAIFIDGCFWHGCPDHGSMPKSNHIFWRSKLETNRERDRYVCRVLRRKGWSVMRVWEHELKTSVPSVALRLRRELLRASLRAALGRQV